jgi:cytochrome c oxidase assembly protein subunit 16
MPAFQSKRFRRTTTATSNLGERLGAYYRLILPKYPFLLFGLPFISVIVAGSFVLTPATALRYERHDRKVRQLGQEEAMELGLKGADRGDVIRRNPRRRLVGSERDEYYVCGVPFPDCLTFLLASFPCQSSGYATLASVPILIEGNKI